MQDFRHHGQKVLQGLYPDLVQSLPGKELAHHLYSKELLTKDEFDQVCLESKTISDRNEVMVTALINRGPTDVVNQLIGCLESVGACASIIEKIQQRKGETSLIPFGMFTNLFVSIGEGVENSIGVNMK